MPILAADEAPVLRQRAEQLAAADRCEEALPRARRARELDPRDARAALVEGRCQLRLGLYRDAIPALGAARQLDGSLPGVSTDLAQCHYHLDEIEAASAELDRAEQQNTDDARMHLYRGLVLLKQSKEREAAASFDRAGGLDPSLTEIAALYAGRTWATVREREKAAAALERARSADPNSEWARAADRELEALEAPYQRHAWAQIRGGVEHDSNVTLRNSVGFDPLTASLIVDTSANERQDARAVFEVEAGAEFLRDPDQSLGGAVGYDGNAHADIHVLDLQYPWLTFWYDRRLAEDTWLRLQPVGGYAWLETDPFVAHGGGTVALSHAFTERLGGQVFTRVNYNDFLFRIRPDPVVAFVDPVLSERLRRFRNRDGVQIDAGLEGSYDLVPGRTKVRAGSAYERYESEGRDWERHGSRSWVGVTQALPLDLVLEVNGRFYWHPYDHRSSFDLPSFAVGTGSKRHDEIWEGEAELRYPVTDWLEISARGKYIDHESNVRTFDFDRWIAGGFVTLSWNNTRDH